MEFSARSRPRSSLSNRQHFYCYTCAKKYTLGTESSNLGIEDQNSCKYCGSDFVEFVSNPLNFRPNSIASYELPVQISESQPTGPVNEPSYRIIRRTIRLSNSSPFVKDVLMQLFPQVFRRASLDRIETIRNILSTLNLFDVNNDSTNGPADKGYIEKLEKKPYKDVLIREKFTNCPICTDNFNESDLVIALDCQHLFHESCILPWLELNNSCPNCRQPLPRQHS